MSALSIIQAGGAEAGKPWPRHMLTTGAWRDLAGALAESPELGLVGMWADTREVHALFLHAAPFAPFIASTVVVEGAYPALSPGCPPAAWFERMVHDLWGHAAEGARDLRPWLDHGRFAHARPLSPRPIPVPAAPEPPEFAAPEDEAWHQVPLGPVHGLIATPLHLRATVAGETVRRLELRAGYAHRGHLTLMRGKSPRAAARFAARIAADATVAHALAFARAAEAAFDVAVPPRAAALRLAMAEIERVAVHLAGVEAVLAAIGHGFAAGEMARRREAMLRACAVAFGHRMMMDCVIPGGVAGDLPAAGATALLAALPEIPLVAADALAGAATVSGKHAGGFIGRAAGEAFDARLLAEGGDYRALGFAPVIRREGDAAARLAVRLGEIAESVRMVRALLGVLPDGPLSAALPMGSGEGFGVAESARGDVWHWLRLDGGLIAAAFACDPAWRHFPLLEAAMAGVPFTALELTAASLDCSVPGADL